LSVECIYYSTRPCFDCCERMYVQGVQPCFHQVSTKNEALCSKTDGFLWWQPWHYLLVRVWQLLFSLMRPSICMPTSAMLAGWTTYWTKTGIWTFYNCNPHTCLVSAIGQCQQQVDPVQLSETRRITGDPDYSHQPMPCGYLLSDPVLYISVVTVMTRCMLALSRSCLTVLQLDYNLELNHSSLCLLVFWSICTLHVYSSCYYCCHWWWWQCRMTQSVQWLPYTIILGTHVTAWFAALNDIYQLICWDLVCLAMSFEWSPQLSVCMRWCVCVLHYCLHSWPLITCVINCDSGCHGWLSHSGHFCDLLYTC